MRAYQCAAVSRALGQVIKTIGFAEAVDGRGEVSIGGAAPQRPHASKREVVDRNRVEGSFHLRPFQCLSGAAFSIGDGR